MTRKPYKKTARTSMEVGEKFLLLERAANGPDGKAAWIAESRLLEVTETNRKEIKFLDRDHGVVYVLWR